MLIQDTTYTRTTTEVALLEGARYQGREGWWWVDEGKWVQVALGEVSSCYKKEILFAVGTMNHWNNFPRDMAECTSHEVFKM